MPFDLANPNLQVWLREEPTDPSATKGFQRGGGFKGTALNATYVMKRLTQAFGPVGLGWGYTIRRSEVVIGAPVFDPNNDVEVIGHESVQVTEIDFFYHPAGCQFERGLPVGTVGPRASFTQVGQTTYVGWSHKNKKFSTDEEAWKKSLTDAITKAASHIGIGADIHLGLFDDNKYVAARRDEEEAEADRQARDAVAAEVQELVDALVAAQDAGAYEDTAALVRKLWPSLTLKAHQTALTNAAKDARKRLAIPEPAPRAA